MANVIFSFPLRINVSFFAKRASKVINVGTIQVPTLTASSSSICAGTSVALTVTNCTSNVTWSTGQTGNTINVTPTNNASTGFADKIPDIKVGDIDVSAMAANVADDAARTPLQANSQGVKVTPAQRAMADQADNLSQVSPAQKAEATYAATHSATDGGATAAKALIQNAKVGETITVPITKEYIVPPKGIPEASFWKKLGKGTNPPEWKASTSGNIQASIVNGKLEIWDGLHRLNEAVKNGETSVQISITK